ncbi:MAG TPA: 5'-methylthioadenosine/adenosylhomocysteine nucleosidase [Aquabacterium sp.]|uniref:5'-methylthioadenosine/adenosylhomocysteine nucleosidase n=1 Tax=Aquabacterium sp. TaxID=1872578 RepID=UPI002DA59505|nr:5'-methylthioadenosine/adenosylhomocysteine nucleosidase [Aquabacterium sp.]HET6787519.1 5'-methylthioadenosine/adenosylhomocysteine nucleosidase [Aquabacterium sp.]HEX5371972.1 5'-methylthioadenosine/adenosylhomocysteine nucleosidase [Aquabacterium sp.]
MNRLALVAAMPEELQALLDTMPDETPVRRGGREFWCGHLHGVEVVAVLSGIGKVAAAITTTLLISEFKVDALLFTGVAGGLGPDVRVGDVVVATDLVQHDMDASPLFPRHEIPGRGITRLPASPALSEALARGARQALCPEALGQGGPLSDVHLHELGLQAPRVHTGLILSGDRFIGTAADSQALRQAFPDALAVEMEGAAIAQVCMDLALPFAVVRTISDRADDAAHVDFMRFVSDVAQRYSSAIVAQVLRSWPAHP